MATIIQGRVIDVSGKPVVDAAVFFLASPGSHPDIALLTDTNGRYALPAVAAPGTYRVGANGAGRMGAAEAHLTGIEPTVELDIRITDSPP